MPKPDYDDPEVEERWCASMEWADDDSFWEED